VGLVIARPSAEDVPPRGIKEDAMAYAVGSLDGRPIEPGMIVLGADTTLVGEVMSIDANTMVVVRRPLPAITLPLDIVDIVVDDVIMLTVSADAADSLGEMNADLYETSRSALV